jgi:hypothetical protein
MIDTPDKSDWRSVMLAQYGIFGTIAGLEVASLSIFAALLKPPLVCLSKILFTVTTLILLIEVPLILWLINEERKVAYNEQNMVWFRKNERLFRNILIYLMVSGWLLILTLLISVIWL